MRHALTLHPDSVSAAVESVSVDVARTPGDVLGLRYVVTGRLADLALPAPAASARADRLWEHSCFEAFLGDEWGEAYAELNVSPSTCTVEAPPASGRMVVGIRTVTAMAQMLPRGSGFRRQEPAATR